jgi:hypothetical protein
MQNKLLEEIKAKEEDEGLVRIHAPVLPVKEPNVLDKILHDKEI